MELNITKQNNDTIPGKFILDVDTRSFKIYEQHTVIIKIRLLFPLKVETDIFPPLEIVRAPTAYSSIWILVRKAHRQQFGVEIHKLVDSASNVVMIRLNVNCSANQ